jgi:tripartite-type tricarboxylate transporter receptor subunit TctC
MDPKALRGSRSRLHVLAASAAIPLLASCGGASGETEAAAGGAATAEPAACADFPSEDITLLVPYSAGGGFDAWARLLAPYIEENLGGDVSVRVENQPGGGGMRAVNTLAAAEPDGTTLLFTEPGYIAVNQILGTAPGDFEVTDLTFLGQTTADPQVFVVAADSDISSIEDLAAAERIRHAGQDISPIETITYDAFGVEADYILHEGTSDVVLAVRRGDAEATVASLSSILSFIEAGEVKPILYLGTEKVSPDLVGYEYLQDVQTAAEAGHPELADVLEQHRVLVTAPDTPNCIADPLEEALAQTLEDPEFLQAAEEAGLRVVPASAEETTTFVENTVNTFQDYSEVLEEAASG